MIWLDDILENIVLVESFTEGVSFDAFRTDRMRLYATVRCFEIMSEASRRLSVDLKNRHTNVQWQRLASVENILRHKYGALSPERLWRFLDEHVPHLRAAVEQELGVLDDPG